MKKLITLLLVLMMTLAFAGCGKKQEATAPETPETPETTEESTPEETPDDGQNPAMNFVGNYECERADILIEADGDEGMKATIHWGSSAWETAYWEMSGTFDPETLVFEYHDCVRTNLTFDDDGKEKESEEVYTGGHGFMTFTDADPLTLTWQDDQEHQADDMVFTYVSPAE